MVTKVSQGLWTIHSISSPFFSSGVLGPRAADARTAGLSAVGPQDDAVLAAAAQNLSGDGPASLIMRVHQGSPS